ANILREIRDLEEGLRHTTSDWAERMAEWEKSVRDDQPDWEVVEVRNAGDNSARYYYYEDGSIRAASYAPTIWTSTFRGTNHLPVIGSFRLEQLTDPLLPSGGPGRSVKGMSALSEFMVDAVALDDPEKKEAVRFVKVPADFANAEKPLE